MPKDKKNKESDESSSDSAPEDKEPPTKKTKANTSSSRKEDEDEPTWVLESKRLVKVREFRGKALIDIREYYEDGGVLKPGKKGISLSTNQWQKLKTIITEVDDVLKKL